jgi:hypothetical protein
MYRDWLRCAINQITQKVHPYLLWLNPLSKVWICFHAPQESHSGPLGLWVMRLSTKAARRFRFDSVPRGFALSYYEIASDSGILLPKM